MQDHVLLSGDPINVRFQVQANLNFRPCQAFRWNVMESFPSRSSRSSLTGWLLFLGVSAGFALLYVQAPLFYSNQFQYFLHGLADAGWGQLRDDWLARTTDPTPMFSRLVALSASVFPVAIFQVYHASLLGLYALSVLGVFIYLGGSEFSWSRGLVFLAFVGMLHSGMIRWLSYQTLGFDYPWFLQAGLAGQYILGGFLQPSMFGVLLLVAVWQFLSDRPAMAGLSVGLAALMHSTYLLPGALMMLGFLACLGIEKRWRDCLICGGLALLFVMFPIAYILREFSPTSPELFAESQRLLVHVRIPHHCRVDLWLDWVAGLQIAWMLLAVALTKGTRLFLPLAIPLILGGLLTLLQVWSQSDTLALLFPWRVSSVLVPLSTAVILSRLINILPLGNGTSLPIGMAFLTLVILMGCGIWIRGTGRAFHSAEEDRSLVAFVKEHHQPGEVYGIPVRIPNLVASTRGSLSSDYKPAPVKRKDGRLIPVDLQGFRLQTGAPLFVDFKSIPYRDTDVVEWHRRLLLANQMQELLQKKMAVQALALMEGEDLTHVVTPVQVEVNHDRLVPIFSDESYRLYQIRSETGRP